ncbi:hypothetical protein WI664_09100, partial [Vibrio cholerae]
DKAGGWHSSAAAAPALPACRLKVCWRTYIMMSSTNANEPRHPLRRAPFRRCATRVSALKLAVDGRKMAKK